MSKFDLKFICLVICFHLIFAPIAAAYDYEVYNDSQLTSALSSATAGESIGLHSATYTVGLNPTNSGTNDSNRITIEVASGASVYITATRGIDLRNGQDWISFQKGSGSVFQLKNCTVRFLDADGNTGIILDGITVDTSSVCPSSYYTAKLYDVDQWEIRNNSFALSNTTANHDMFYMLGARQMDIGPGNTFGNSTHGSFYIDTGSKYIRVHENTLQNWWRHGMNLQYVGYFPSDNTASQYLIIEENLFNQCSKNTQSNPYEPEQGRAADGIEIEAIKSIFRFNTFDRSNTAFFLYSRTGHTIEKDWFYHNTSYHASTYGDWGQGFDGSNNAWNLYGTVQDLYMYNNIFFDSEAYDWFVSNQGGTHSNLNFDTNLIADSSLNISVYWLGSVKSSKTAVDALSAFSNTVVANPNFKDAANQDFTLDSGQAIDNGRYIATVVGVSTNLVTLGTNEAYAFAPSNWNIPNFNGDTIYDDYGNSYVVEEQNAHNQITLDDASSLQAGYKLTLVEVNGSAPDLGRYESGWSIENPLPTTQQECVSDPQTVNLSFTTPVNAYCRESTNPAHTQYTDMSNQIDNGEGTTSHNENFSQSCGGYTNHRISCNTESDGSGDESTQVIITIDVATQGSQTVPPNTVIRNVDGLQITRTIGASTISKE